MMGQIATNIQGASELTPLQKQLAHFSKMLTYVVLCIVVIVFLFGLLTSKSLLDIFTTSVALAVSAIPE
ncbi:MAG: hypothetical protein H6765_00615 [Candidatus Peribacteria bacterium]|nr:MAG: hypothetical protein H6765_00615 [Candidatus Peribacteria bacterium]